MSNYIFTGLNEKYWGEHGASWIYTLREVAKYNEEVVVVDFGLQSLAKKKLIEKGATIVPGEGTEDIRTETIKQISKYAKSNKGKFVYWDADVFFEDNIDEIFIQIKEKILLTNNKNPGFIGGPHYQWAFVEDIISFMKLAKQKITSIEIVKCLNSDFEKFVEYVDDTWNFTELPGGLDTSKEKPRVIHPTGTLKHLLKGKGFLFQDRKNDEYLKFIENKSVTLRKLVKKSV